MEDDTVQAEYFRFLEEIVKDNSNSSANNAPGQPTRRDFLFIATAAAGTVGAIAVVWPMVDQLNPDASTLAAGAPIDFDLSKMQPGQQVVVTWRGRPVFVVRRTPENLKTLQEAALLNRLADPNSAELQQPPYADNWHRSLKPEYGILVGICTHLGCIPNYEPLPTDMSAGSNWLGGYFCPCHGSKYDLAGRVFSGVPAPYNLPVPPYHFVNDTMIRIGENPPDTKFDFGSIRQI